MTRLARTIMTVLLIAASASQAAASTPAEVINNFAFSAAKILAESEGSYFFSPFSIISAFGMAYAGATGDTASEMERALGFSSGLHGELREFVQDIAASGQVFSANRVWLGRRLSLRRKYQENLSRNYRSEAEQLDMENRNAASLRRINSWVREQTRGKIPSLLSSLDPETRMIITNAVYFNAQWQSKFSKNLTKPEKFYDGERVSEVLMMKKDSKFSYGEFDGVKVVQIPYEGRRLSMLVILPPKDEPDAVKTLDAVTLKKWLGSLEKYQVDLWLPKFKTEKSYELAKLFKTLGVARAFSDAADFSGISETEKLKIDAVIHKTFIDVDEEKTEATAATGIMMTRATAMRPDLVRRAEFHADHPFTYFILDNWTETILFMGRQTF